MTDKVQQRTLGHHQEYDTTQNPCKSQGQHINGHKSINKYSRKPETREIQNHDC